MSTNNLKNRNIKNSFSYNNLSEQNKNKSNVLFSDKRNKSESKNLKLKAILLKDNELKLPSINIINPLLNSYVQNHKIILNDINKNLIPFNKNKNVKFFIDKFQPQNDLNNENFISNKIQNYMNKTNNK